jgi:hypothetical protein
VRAMSSDKTRLEIGHVLFIHIVAYSKLLLKQQSELLSELNEIVSGTNEFREADSAGKLIRLPTGDGMALVFRTNTEAPAECAMEIAQTLKSHPAIQLRMGIHSGPVNEVVDVNQRANKTVPPLGPAPRRSVLRKSRRLVSAERRCFPDEVKSGTLKKRVPWSAARE